MMYLDLKTEAGRTWLRAHEKTRKKPLDMPRALLERELAEWMLADKEKHTGLDLGAKPRALPFHHTTQWGVTPDRARPMPPRTADAKARTTAYKIDEAAKCVTLWRAVIEQQAFDLLRMWGASADDHRSARMFFEGGSDRLTETRESVCAMAMIEPEALTAAHKAGRLATLAGEAVGRERWKTRMENRQGTTKQPDLFYSMGMR